MNTSGDAILAALSHLGMENYALPLGIFNTTHTHIHTYIHTYMNTSGDDILAALSHLGMENYALPLGIFKQRVQAQREKEAELALALKTAEGASAATVDPASDPDV
jgi:hypothetical protein